jgi:uncharacterized protein YqeY
MEIQKRVEEDLKKAMRERAEVARDTLRMLLSELKNKQGELGRDLKLEEELAVFQRAVKMRQESITQFRQGGREDLVAKETAELAVVLSYLPEPLSEDEVRCSLREILKELGIQSKKDFGVAMKALMAKHKGRVDGKLVQKILGEMLT